MYISKYRCVWAVIVAVYFIPQVVTQQNESEEFAPTVTATCKAGHMNIRINFQNAYTGAIHARDYRSPSCMTTGNGTYIATLGINLFAQKGASDYCGVVVNNNTESRSIHIAVRVHRTLELADDKIYVIACGKAGFKNARNETYTLRLIDDHGNRVQEVVHGRRYTLRAAISKPDGSFGIRVKSCFAFNKRNTSELLIDDRGCPKNTELVSGFQYNISSGTADAIVASMFRFPDSSEVHFQCDIAVCKGGCEIPDCSAPDSRSLYPVSKRGSEDGVVIAATSAYVLEPGEAPVVQQLCDGSIQPQWLVWLCIALGVLFLIMLLINVFLCSAMTCSCARTEVIEKEPSIIEEYDPYRSWHGSQYGSRYSLHGGPVNKGYTSGGSTIHSTRSVEYPRSGSTNSDHYAIVHSRPGSRYSGGAQGLNGGNRTPRGPPSHM